jgi:hypothetical protein
MFSLEAPFVSSGGVKGIKASKKCHFSMQKIVRYPVVDITKNGNFFEKFFSNVTIKKILKNFFIEI